MRPCWTREGVIPLSNVQPLYDYKAEQWSQLPRLTWQGTEAGSGEVEASRGWVRGGCGVKVAVRREIEAHSASTRSYPSFLACRCVVNLVAVNHTVGYISKNCHILKFRNRRF